jgi:hypothetical protein
MRTTRAAALLLCLAMLAAGPARAGDREAALAVLDAAIKAHGGGYALKRARTAQRTGSGTFTSSGKDVPFAEELLWQLPQHFRLTTEVGSGQARGRVVVVVGPDKGWQSTGGMVAELGKDRVEELHEEAYVLWLATLAPLRDDGFELTPLPETRQNGRALAGVKVASKGHADARLFFDKESGLLVKIERRAREAGQTVDKEYAFGGHKEFDGVKLPTRVVEMHNGGRFVDLTNVSYKLLRGVNDSAFSRP